MKRKRKLSTGEVYKHKARLNYDGSKQCYGIDYWDTYSPLAQWPSIRLILSLALSHGWKTRQVDYVLAFTQADVDDPHAYMAIPKGMTIPGGGNPDDYVLHLKKNMYGRKNASLVWFKTIKAKLEQAGFVPSKHDECVFYRKS
jgi:histone deacetylase 1/2